MDEYFHQTDETRRAIEQIRAFCETPALNGGGMMLVTGQRGVGKTRLVDEALNDRRELAPWKDLLYARMAKLPAPGNVLRWALVVVGVWALATPNALAATWALVVAGLWTLTTGLGVLAEGLKPRIGRLLAIASGHDPCRCRLRINRRPRGVTRLLLPVPVDPFFPDGGAAVAPGQPAPAEHSDLDGDTLALLRNLVFALTSAIDPRSGVRRHGRTLKARLGTLTYWFTRTALIKPQRRPKSALTIALCLLLAFLTGVVLHFWIRDPTFAPWTDPGYVWAVCWRSVWLTIPATLVAWLGLRYLDLARLRRMSAHLYDLIHAQQFSVEAQASIERTWRWEAKGQRLLQVLAVLAVGGGLLASPSIRDWIVAQSQEVFGAADDSGETVDKDSNPPAAGWTLVKTTVPPPAEHPISPISAVIALAGMAVRGFTGCRRTPRHASFGAGNRVWLISLLRRYLYLLHRAGVEPVLVIDEIDKLDVNANTVWAQTAADRQPADQSGANQRSGPGQLDRFIATLVRLKQSLGAEVIWILIDSNALHARVIADRNRPDDRGPLATLIQCEVGLNPIPFKEYKAYYKRIYDQDRARTKGSAVANQRLPEDRQLAGWWLEARGVFFGLSVRRAEPSPMEAANGRPVDTLALFLADLLDHLRKDDWSAFTRCVGAQPRDWQELSEQITRSPWHRRYLEIGLMELAARLVDPTRAKPLYKEFNFDTEAPDLDPGSPQSLKRKGERGLFVFLQNVYDAGDETLLIDKGCGIPTRPPGDNYDAEIRVVAPEQWPPLGRSAGAQG